MPHLNVRPRLRPARLLLAGLAAPALFAAAALPAAAQPTAEPPPEFTIATEQGWEGGAVGFPNTNRFSHCGIQRPYDNGITLVFNTNPLNQTTIALQNPEWSFAEGDSQEIDLRIDETLGGSAQAVAGGPEVLVIPIGEDGQVIEALRRGNVLYLDTDQGNFEFPLTGTFNALAELAACVDRARELAEAAAAAAPPPPSVANPGDPPLANNAVRRGQGPMTVDSLAGLLRAAGFQEFRIIDPAQIPDSALDLAHVWTLDPVLAGVHQRPLNANADLPAFTAEYAQAILSFCTNQPEPEIAEPVAFAPGFGRQSMTVECAVDETQTNAIHLLTVRDQVAYTAFVQQADLADQPAVTATSEQLAGFIDALFEGVEGAMSQGGEAAPSASPNAPITLPEDAVPALNDGSAGGG